MCAVVCTDARVQNRPEIGPEPARPESGIFLDRERTGIFPVRYGPGPLGPDFFSKEKIFFILFKYIYTLPTLKINNINNNNPKRINGMFLYF